jgi:hypothetical protein
MDFVIIGQNHVEIIVVKMDGVEKIHVYVYLDGQE